MKNTETGVYVRVDVFLQSTLARCKNIYFDFHWICTKNISSVPHGNIADVTYKLIPLRPQASYDGHWKLVECINIDYPLEGRPTLIIMWHIFAEAANLALMKTKIDKWIDKEIHCLLYYCSYYNNHYIFISSTRIYQLAACKTLSI